MALFKTKQHAQTTKQPHIFFERLYQYADSTYLPDSSQPNPEENYEITTGKYTPHASTRYMNVVIGSNGMAKSRGVDTDKKLPELYGKREDCCGCTACYAICPAGAIVMRPCEEGFLYPVVKADECVRCYKCIGVCPIKMKDSQKAKEAM